jgi:GNAT superfamily N-acetyltransferase
VTTIRRADRRDWRTLRAIRLAALADAPDAFGSTYEGSKDRDDASWQAWADGSFVEGDTALFLAFSDEDPAAPVGIVVGARIDEGDEGERPDEAQIWSMWVAPEARRQGVGGLLLEAVAAWARTLPGVRSCVLHVTEGNVAAETLYVRAGFVVDEGGPIEPLRPGSPLLMRTMRRPP